MSQSDTRITLRLSDEEHQKLLKDSEGFKSISDYLRTFLKTYPPIKPKVNKPAGNGSFHSRQET